MAQERRRAPPGWSTWLGTLGDSSAKPRDRAHAASEVLAHRRRWLEQDRIRDALDRMDATEGWETKLGEVKRPKAKARPTDADPGDETMPATGETSDGAVRLAHRARLAFVDVGGIRCHVDGRWLPAAWRAEPRVTAGRMRACERTWVGAVRASGDAAWLPRRCGQVTCPVCCHARAGRDVPVLVDVLRCYVAAGCTVVHLTSTQRALPGAGPVVIEDRDVPHVRHDGPRAVAGEAGTATGGESLACAWDRLEAALRASTDGRGYREAWRASVLAEVRGIEVTQRDPRTGRLRWHVHAHRLLVLAPDVVLEVGSVTASDGSEVTGCVLGGAWWDGWRARWSEVADAEDGAQLCRVVASPASAEDELLRACRQVLKYPGKVSSMTDAGVVEYLAACKGRRPHRRMGDLHSRDGAGRIARALALRSTEDDPASVVRDDVDVSRVLADVGLGGEDEHVVGYLLHDLASERGDAAALAAVAAWGFLVAAPVDEDDEADPIVGTRVALVRGAVRIVTRARLHVWARVGASLHVAVTPTTVVTDGQIVALCADDTWSPVWVQVDARTLADASGVTWRDVDRGGGS